MAGKQSLPSPVFSGVWTTVNNWSVPETFIKDLLRISWSLGCLIFHFHVQSFICSSRTFHNESSHRRWSLFLLLVVAPIGPLFSRGWVSLSCTLGWSIHCHVLEARRCGWMYTLYVCLLFATSAYLCLSPQSQLPLRHISSLGIFGGTGLFIDAAGFKTAPSPTFVLFDGYQIKP